MNRIVIRCRILFPLGWAANCCIPMMKSWNGLDNAAATAESPRPPRTQVQWRALAATVVTTAALYALAGLRELSPYLLNGGSRFGGQISDAKPFQWSEMERYREAFHSNQTSDQVVSMAGPIQTTISAQEHLDFHECFGEFECAKLKVPLDYFNGTYPDKTVSVAIAKLPAKVPVDDPRYGGPILLNPGGPGGPGAWFALLAAKNLQTIVDPGVDPRCLNSDARYFDLIGFDPRGIGETEPLAECIQDEPSTWSWSFRENNEGILGSSDAALGRLWSMTHAWGKSCKLAAEAHDGFDIKQYVSTAYVARDMLEIVERHAEWVAKKVKELSTKEHTGPQTRTIPEVYTPGKAKLQYWGFSYGTYLGSTFASMFPDRVSRVVLDGVVSAYDYNHSLGNGSLVDTEKGWKSFYTYCYNADECALRKENATVEDIKERFERILQSLYHNPLPVVSANGPEVLTYSDLKMIMFSATYQPQAVFAFLADLFVDIEQGGGETIDLLSFAYRRLHVYSCPINGSDPVPSAFPGVAEWAILCGDGLDQSHVDLQNFVEYWNLLEDISPVAGSIWAMLRMRCAAWKFNATYTFRGPFGGETSHPVLFVSNTADPVTPLRSGRYMSSLFPGSGLLVSDNAGHCSISTVNPCTLTHIRRYFQSGVLPTIGTVCTPPPSPFSLNSTDPKSPFYDPSLGGSNVEISGEGRSEFHSVGWKLLQSVAESDVFGFQRLIGGERHKGVMEIVADGYY
ncbi:alpha/beta-hydrolase [Pyrenochaeta sp. DS3sAY3a]|nr:alpha/beta-hydrolase [Pyrenochaeta sp. DS3sAY3a]